MNVPRIAAVRAYTVAASGGADYHDQQGYHWIDDHIATPMSRYPGYEQSRRSFGKLRRMQNTNRCQCSRWDSNPYWSGFKPPASALGLREHDQPREPLRGRCRRGCRVR